MLLSDHVLKWIEIECVLFVMSVRIIFENAHTGASMDGLSQLSCVLPRIRRSATEPYQPQLWPHAL